MGTHSNLNPLVLMNVDIDGARLLLEPAQQSPELLHLFERPAELVNAIVGFREEESNGGRIYHSRPSDPSVDQYASRRYS